MKAKHDMRKKMKGWQEMSGDQDWWNHGGKWGRKAPDGVWYVLRFTNLKEDIGEEIGADRYQCRVIGVELALVSKQEIADAIAACDPQLAAYADTDEAALIDCLTYDGDGVGDALEEFTSDTDAWKCRDEARKYVEACVRNACPVE